MTRARADYAISAKDQTQAGIDSARRNFKALDKSVFDVKTSILALGRSILPVIGVAGLGSLVKSNLDAADAIQKLSIQTGASVEALSQYKLVASQTGVEFDTLTTAWQKQSIRIAEAASGTGVAKEALERLGLAASDLVRLRPEDQFEAIAEAISKVKNPAEQAAIAVKLWEEEGVRLLRTTKGGAEAIRKIRDEMDRLGGTMTGEMVDASARANDELDKLGHAAGALGNNLAILVAGPLADAVSGLNTGVIAARDFARELFGISRAADSMGLDDVRAEISETEAAQLKAIATAREYRESLIGSPAVRRDKSAEFEQEAARLQQRLIDLRARETALTGGSAKPPPLPPPTGGTGGAGTNTLAKEAEALIKSLRTPYEEYANQIERIKTLHGAGLLSAQDYARAMQSAGDSLQQATGNTIDLRQNTEDLVQVFADGTGRAFTMNELLGEQADVLGSLKTAQDTYNDAVALYSLLAEKGLLTDEQRIAALEKLSTELSSSANRGSDAARDLGLTFSSAFEEAILEGGKLRDVLKGLEKDIAAIIARKFITEPLAAGITAGIQSIPGFRAGAEGGRPIPFKPIIVGEKRPELFVPDSAGTLYPSVPGGATNNYSVTYAPQVTAMDAASVSRVLTSPDARKAIVGTINSAFARIGQRPGLRT